MFNKLIKELKANKYTTIIFCIFLGLFVIGWILYGMVMPSSGKPVYGDRLDDIEDVPVTDENESNLVSSLKDKDIVSSCSVHVSGKIINVIVNVKDGTSISKAKALNTTVLKNLTSEQKKLYDIQLFLVSDSKGYPVIGYKGASENKFIF